MKELLASDDDEETQSSKVEKAYVPKLSGKNKEKKSMVSEIWP